jgi:hypothetical protein
MDDDKHPGAIAAKPTQETLPPAPKTAKEGMSRAISEGVLLLVASTAAYIACYLHEEAYASYFGIPQEFISLSITNLLTFAAGTVFIMIGLVHLLYQFSRLWEVTEGHDSAFAVFIKRRSFIFLLVVVAIAATRAEWRLLRGVFIVVVCILALDFFGPFDSKNRRMTGTYWQRFATLLGGENDWSSWLLGPKPTQFTVLCLTIFGAVAFFSLLMGRGQANSRSVFPVVESGGRTEVVLRRYGDQFVLAKYDPTQHRLNPEYRLVPVADLKETVKAKRLGALPEVKLEPVKPVGHR